MDRKNAIKLFRRDIECLSHDKCSDCILEEACDPMKTPLDSEYIEAYGMAIKSLSAEPCEDCISRQAMHIEFEKWITYGEYKYSNATKYLYDRIDRLPSVTPKQKMGRWLAVEDEDMNTVGYYCSECDLPLETEERTPFCPNCGAKMESEDQK